MVEFLSKMHNHIPYFALVLLVFATTINHGEKTSGLISKYNERRAAGILAQPRVGRTTGMSSFARLDGVAGLVHYPRVGRSRTFSPSTDFYQDTPFEFEGIPELLDHGQVDVTSLMNLDYQKYLYNTKRGEKKVNDQQLGISARDGQWIGQSRNRVVRQDQEFPRSHECTDHSIEEAWALFITPPRDAVGRRAQSTHSLLTDPIRETVQSQQDVVS